MIDLFTTEEIMPFRLAPLADAVVKMQFAVDATQTKGDPEVVIDQEFVAVQTACPSHGDAGLEVG